MPDYMFVNMFRLTNIMNSFISNLNNYDSYQQEVLFEGYQVIGDITLNQPFTNFPFIIIVGGNDVCSEVVPKMFSTKNFDYLLKTSKGPVCIANTNNYWYIEPYARGTTTTFFKTAYETMSIYGVYGLKFKVT